MHTTNFTEIEQSASSTASRLLQLNKCCYPWRSYAI